MVVLRISQAFKNIIHQTAKGIHGGKKARNSGCKGKERRASLHSGDGNVGSGEHRCLEHGRGFRWQCCRHREGTLRAKVPEEAGAIGMQGSGGGINHRKETFPTIKGRKG